MVVTVGLTVLVIVVVLRAGWHVAIFRPCLAGGKTTVSNHEEWETEDHLQMIDLQAFAEAAGTFLQTAAAGLQIGRRAAASTMTMAMASSPSCKRRNFMVSPQ